MKKFLKILKYQFSSSKSLEFKNHLKFKNIKTKNNNYNHTQTNQIKIISIKENLKKSEKIKLNQINQRETPIDLFLKTFKENFPLHLNKSKNLKIDNNLTCFFPFDKLLTKINTTFIAKTYLDILTSKQKDFSNICDEHFSKILNSKIEKIVNFKVEEDEIIKYDISLNKSLKKVKFLINLHDIKNYMCIGFDPDRNIIKNTKNFQVLQDHTIGIEKLLYLFFKFSRKSYEPIQKNKKITE